MQPASHAAVSYLQDQVPGRRSSQVVHGMSISGRSALPRPDRAMHNKPVMMLRQQDGHRPLARWSPCPLLSGKSFVKDFAATEMKLIARRGSIMSVVGPRVFGCHGVRWKEWRKEAVVTDNRTGRDEEANRRRKGRAWREHPGRPSSCALRLSSPPLHRRVPTTSRPEQAACSAVRVFPAFADDAAISLPKAFSSWPLLVRSVGQRLHMQVGARLRIMKHIPLARASTRCCAATLRFFVGL